MLKYLKNLLFVLILTSLLGSFLFAPLAKAQNPGDLLSDSPLSVRNVFFRYGDVDKTTLEIKAISLEGIVAESTFTKIAPIDDIFYNPDPSKLGTTTGEVLFQGTLSINGAGGSFIIKTSAEDIILSIYSPVFYEIEGSEIKLHGKKCTGCRDGWGRLDSTKYKVGGAVAKLSLQNYYLDWYTKMARDNPVAAARYRELANIINEETAVPDYSHNIQPYQETSTLDIGQLQTRIGNQICHITRSLKELYDNESYWIKNRPSSFGALMHTMSLGIWDTAAFEFTTAGKQKLQEIKSQITTLKEYTEALKGKTGDGPDVKLDIKWCKFDQNMDPGQIVKWGKSDGSETDTLYWVLKRLNIVNTAIEAQKTPSLYGTEDCGCEGNWFQKPVCSALCYISQAVAKFIDWAIKLLMEAAGISQNFPLLVSPAYAAAKDDFVGPTPTIETVDVKALTGRVTLAQSLDPNQNKSGPNFWVFRVWKFSLSLVNAAMVAILIFLAFVNILRIQIDTYALKKILPMLILGVILANFSLLICRMIVDFSDVLVKTFVINRADMAQDLSYALGLFSPNQGWLAAAGSGIIGAAIVLVFVPGGQLMSLLGMAVALILALLPGLAILFLALLLLIRVAVVHALTAVAPLAFMMLVLPPTQGLFKKWWSEFAKWVFMAPVVFFLLKITSMIVPPRNLDGTPGTFQFWTYATALVILYLCIQVPFKMGGAVMGVWGGWAKAGVGRATKWTGRAANRVFGVGRDWMADKTGAQWLKKIPAPKNLIEGWITGAQESEKEFMAVEAGKGRTGREAMLALFRLQKRGMIVDEAESQQKSIYEAKGSMIANSSEGTPENLKRILNNSAVSGNYAAARDAYLGLAAQGEASQKDQEAFKNLAGQKGQSADALVATTAAESLSLKADKPEGFLISPYTKDEKGKVVERDSDDMALEYLKKYRRLPGTAEEQVAQLRNLTRLVIDPSNPEVVLDRSKLVSAQQKAVAQLFSELGESSELVKGLGPIGITAAATYKIDKLNLSDPDIESALPTDAELRRKVTDALAGVHDLGSLSIKLKFDARFVAKAKNISDNFPDIKKVMDARRKKLEALADTPNKKYQLEHHDEIVRKLEVARNKYKNPDEKMRKFIKQLDEQEKKRRRT